MNTEGLKPIDARIMKPGDPVVKRNGTGGKLHSVIEAADPSYQAVILWDDGVVHGYTLDGKRFVGSETVAFLPPDPDPVDPSPGNVDKLRKSQVGEGWRIPAHDEKPDRRAKRWSCLNERWVDVSEPGRPYRHVTTYLVPLAPIRMVPLEMKDFVGKPWPLVKQRDGVSQILTVSSREVFAANVGFMNFNHLCDLHPISWDYGVTWVKAEKEEQA